ncbi:hypothetical protein AWN76_011850 [Rhodothermaceae bacterium RA]|nr:hypothetical protein AWN76_011850 [Rhodothermaceae bacterium RA]
MKIRPWLGLVVLVGMLPAGGTRAQDTTRTAPPTRTVAERLQDASLAAYVRKALADDPRLRAFDFEAEAEAGVVTLFGHVDTPEQAARAAEVARRVPGVRQLTSELVVMSSPARLEPGGPPRAPGGTEAAPAEPPSARYHTVASGESLWIIARRYDTSIRAIKRLNNLTSNTVRPGQRLRVR